MRGNLRLKTSLSLSLRKFIVLVFILSLLFGSASTGLFAQGDFEFHKVRPLSPEKEKIQSEAFSLKNGGSVRVMNFFLWRNQSYLLTADKRWTRLYRVEKKDGGNKAKEIARTVALGPPLAVAAIPSPVSSDHILRFLLTAQRIRPAEDYSKTGDFRPVSGFYRFDGKKLLLEKRFPSTAYRLLGNIFYRQKSAHGTVLGSDVEMAVAAVLKNKLSLSPLSFLRLPHQTSLFDFLRADVIGGGGLEILRAESDRSLSIYHGKRLIARSHYILSASSARIEAPFWTGSKKIPILPVILPSRRGETKRRMLAVLEEKKASVAMFGSSFGRNERLGKSSLVLLSFSGAGLQKIMTTAELKDPVVALLSGPEGHPWIATRKGRRIFMKPVEGIGDR